MLYLNTNGDVTILWGIGLLYSERKPWNLTKYHFNLAAYEVECVGVKVQQLLLRVLILLLFSCSMNCVLNLALLLFFAFISSSIYLYLFLQKYK